jgi:hypothetical protein
MLRVSFAATGTDVGRFHAHGGDSTAHFHSKLKAFCPRTAEKWTAVTAPVAVPFCLAPPPRADAPPFDWADTQLLGRRGVLKATHTLERGGIACGGGGSDATVTATRICGGGGGARHLHAITAMTVAVAVAVAVAATPPDGASARDQDREPAKWVATGDAGGHGRVWRVSAAETACVGRLDLWPEACALEAGGEWTAGAVAQQQQQQQQPSAKGLAKVVSAPPPDSIVGAVAVQDQWAALATATTLAVWRWDGAAFAPALARRLPLGDSFTCLATATGVVGTGLLAGMARQTNEAFHKDPAELCGGGGQAAPAPPVKQEEESLMAAPVKRARTTRAKKTPAAAKPAAAKPAAAKPKKKAKAGLSLTTSRRRKPAAAAAAIPTIVPGSAAALYAPKMCADRVWKHGYALLRPADGGCVYEQMDVAEDFVAALAVDDAQGRLYVGGADNCIHLFDLQGGRRLSTTCIYVPIQSMCLSPDKNTLVTGHCDNARVWDTRALYQGKAGKSLRLETERNKHVPAHHVACWPKSGRTLRVWTSAVGAPTDITGWDVRLPRAQVQACAHAYAQANARGPATGHTLARVPRTARQTQRYSTATAFVDGPNVLLYAASLCLNP